MKKHLSFLIILLLLFITTRAQRARFISTGTIEYEKTINLKALAKKILDNDQGTNAQALQQTQNGVSQFKTLKSTLVFSADKALLTPIAPETMASGGVFNTPMADQVNTVYTDFGRRTNVIQKNVNDALLLVKDSIQKIRWKLTNETREIAGYFCRRANGVLLDSIYVVAFYTDKIPVSGGPEWFGGLSGMILELAIPHENVTWIAKKINDGEVDVSTITAPKKGKAMNNKQLYDFLKTLITTNRYGSKTAALIMKGYLL